MQPQVAVTEAFAPEIEIPFSDVPFLVEPGTPGHMGAFLRGSSGGVGCVLQAGRLHLYEDLSPAQVLYPILIMSKLGIRSLILTCSSGGVREEGTPGEWIVVRDHINLGGFHPLEDVHDRCSFHVG